MASFSELLTGDKFIVTAELNPPKGTDLKEVLRTARNLSGWVDAFNLTDSSGAIMKMAPIGAAFKLKLEGAEPILQVTGRDRNRIAIQADLLAASVVGVDNVLCMGGDPPNVGDHPDAKGVFDLDAVRILQAVKSLSSGMDMYGHPLHGTPSFCPGAVANPGTPDIDGELKRMEQKVEAGARFFQTQAVYEPKVFETFMRKASLLGVPVLAGFIILKSGAMARHLNANLPGISVPEDLINQLDAAADKSAKSIEISARIVGEVKSMCRGVHMMAIGWESRIPAILEAAGISKHA
jgi:methylenetetrahydrofolate reductase (NADPH)